MPTIVVDSSTIISCAMNCLLWVFKELKSEGIRFIVPKGVKRELISSGLNSKRFKYEAVRLLEYFSDGTFEVYDKDLKKEASELLSYANSSFYIKNNPLKILQEADAEVAVLGDKINADAIATDERTLRLFAEAPEEIQKMLEHRLKSNVRTDKKMLRGFTKIVGKMQVVRSVELMALAYSKGIFDKLMKGGIPKDEKIKKDTVEGMLFALKFSGCAVSFKEINDYINLLLNLNN